jgi:replicative DNA helicase
MTDALTDQTAERSILGAILERPDLVHEAEGVVSPQHFSDRRHAAVYSALLTMAQAGQSVDLVTLRQAMATSGDLEAVGGATFLAGLLDGTPRMASVSSWTRIVRDKARRRAAKGLAERFALAVGEAETGTDQLIDGLQAGLLRLVETGERRTVKLADVLPAAMADLDRFAGAADAVTGIPCGLIDVDKLLGGWKAGSLYVIAGRSGRGKSAFCAQAVAHAASVGRKCLVFSMEMEPYELAGRMLLSEAEVDRWDLRKESAKADYSWKRLFQAHAKLQELPVWFDQRESPGLVEIRSSVRQQRASVGVDLVVVDYLQRCTVDPKQDRWLAVGDLAKGLKSLARALQVPVIAACQLNADAEERAPTLAMLGQAQSVISAEADLVAMLHPADMAAWKAQSFPQIDFLVVKHRRGATMNIGLGFERACTRFVSMAKGPQ